MAELSEEMVGKLMAMAESFQDVKQQVQQAAQDSQQAVQSAKQIEQTIGSLQSDFASRTSTTNNDADSVKSDERMRAQAADSNAAWAFKTNVYDFGRASDILNASQQFNLHQANLNQAVIKLVNGSVDHYLEGTQLNSRFANAKWQQELRHSDIATENQWESTQETANDSIAAELAKSTQMPDAATEKASK